RNPTRIIRRIGGFPSRESRRSRHFIHCADAEPRGSVPTAHQRRRPRDAPGVLASAGPTRIIEEETAMPNDHFDRRTVLAATTAPGAAALMAGPAPAQGVPPAGTSLPARGDFVVRGAHVLTMDRDLGDLATGDVHVRNGEIVAVGVAVNAPGAETIDGKG